MEDLKGLLSGIAYLRLQEPSNQGRFKLSFYVPLDADPTGLIDEMQRRLAEEGIRASLIWSVDESAGVGLLYVLPERATKSHAIEFLIGMEGFEIERTVFSGDGGNDLEPLTSPFPAALVANADPTAREEAMRISPRAGARRALYCAVGGFLEMNGNYADGILEGVAHYHPGIGRRLAREVAS